MDLREDLEAKLHNHLTRLADSAAELHVLADNDDRSMGTKLANDTSSAFARFLVQDYVAAGFQSLPEKLKKDFHENLSTCISDIDNILSEHLGPADTVFTERLHVMESAYKQATTAENIKLTQRPTRGLNAIKNRSSLSWARPDFSSESVGSLLENTLELKKAAMAYGLEQAVKTAALEADRDPALGRSARSPTATHVSSPENQPSSPRREATPDRVSLPASLAGTPPYNPEDYRTPPSAQQSKRPETPSREALPDVIPETPPGRQIVATSPLPPLRPKRFRSDDEDDSQESPSARRQKLTSDRPRDGLGR